MHKTKLPISGGHIARVAELETHLDMNFSTIEGGFGQASSVKMVRSAMIKGLEATTMECARAGGTPV